jgi:hypothetical protein
VVDMGDATGTRAPDTVGPRGGYEPPRVFRRLFRLSHAAIAGWSSVA